MDLKTEQPIMEVTKGKAEKAFESARAEIEALLQEEDATWGPEYIWVKIVHPITGEVYEKLFGKFEPWQKAWGDEKNIEDIALAKAHTSSCFQMDTKDVVSDDIPSIMKDELGKPYPGGVCRGKIAIGTMGAYSVIDHRISEIISEHLVANELTLGTHLIVKCDMFEECAADDCYDISDNGEIEVIIRECDNDSLWLHRVAGHLDLPETFCVIPSNGFVQLNGPEYTLDIIRVTAAA